MAKSEMIFMSCRGSQLNTRGPVGLIMDGKTLPIAWRDTGDCEDLGFHACYEAQVSIEDFFNAVRIETQNAPGLYYVCAVFDHEDDVDEDDWEHLADMSCEHLSSMGDTILQMCDQAEYGKKETNKWRWA
jgi:hypothetical protein